MDFVCGKKPKEINNFVKFNLGCGNNAQHGPKNKPNIGDFFSKYSVTFLQVRELYIPFCHQEKVYFLVTSGNIQFHPEPSEKITEYSQKNPQYL